MPQSLQLLFYEYVADILNRRTEYRQAHLDHLQKAVDAGTALAGGAIGTTATGAVFVLSGTADVSAFVSGDPYVQNGLVTAVRAEPYTVAVGSL